MFTSISQSWRCSKYVPLATSPTTEDPEAQPGSLHNRPRRRDILHSLPLQVLNRPRLLIFTPLILLPILYLLISSKFGPGAHRIPLSDNPYFYTGEVWEHNDLVSAKLDRCASLGLLRNTSLPLAPHEQLSADEEGELIAQGCGTNETTVIVLSSIFFAEAFKGINTAGEAIYAQSIMSSLNALSYSFVFSSLGWWNHDMRKSMELFHKHRWNTRMILADPEQVDVCWNQEDQKCLKTMENPEGIEAWRLLSFWYWDDPRNPLGAGFTLSPSPRNDNHFLSYSIEPTCRRLPFLAPEDRSHPPQAYLLAKQVQYLSDTPKFSWTIPFLASLQSSLGIRVVAGMSNDDDETKKQVDKSGLKNMGSLDKFQFYDQMSKSFVMVGVGQPRISPSPWDALCMGVPFINPILEWDEADPWNRTKWHAQQWHMTDLNPPYVYSVHARDLDGLKYAIRSALATPIRSFIPDYMRFEYAVDRMASVLDGDWRGVAKGILEERLEQGQGQLFEL